MSQLLKAHNKKVDAVEYRPKFCKYCKKGRGCLRPRQLIRRLIRFFEDRLIHRLHVHVYLWACSACGRSFRHLPPFLKPNKRFATPTIINRTSEVLKRKRRPYRKTALNEAPNPIPIVYDKENVALAHTSVWRWIQCMAETMTQIISAKPKMATGLETETFEFSELQWKEPEYRENLNLARQFLMGQFLVG